MKHPQQHQQVANPMGTGIYYDTPYAFSGGRKKIKKKKKTTAGGYKPVNEKMNQKFVETKRIWANLSSN